MDEQGLFVREPMKGMTLGQATAHVLDAVAPLLYSLSKVEHEYPHCWRHKTPLFFKASEEWFLDLTALTPRALEALDEVTFVPAAGKERLSSMLRSRSSWCLSRTRLWGSPLADPGSPDEVHRLSQVATQGLPAWHEGKPRRTLDVWFDSGVTHALVLQKRFGRKADVYLERTDQHRGWFQSSLLTAVAAGQPAPFNTLLTHGFVVDEAGKKYSKSSKNYLPLQALFEKYSPDVLRLWVLSQDYTRDLRLSKESLARTFERYRKLRNTLRFCLQNTSDFDFTNRADVTQEVHLHLLNEMHQLKEATKAAAARYDFAAGVTALMLFVDAVSSDYFMSLKDTLYCDQPNSLKRREAQFMLVTLLDFLMRRLMPVLPFTVEEVFQRQKAAMGYDETCSLLLTWGPDTLSRRDTVVSELEQFKREVHRGVQASGDPALKGPAQLDLKLTVPFGTRMRQEEFQDYFCCAQVHVERVAPGPFMRGLPLGCCATVPQSPHANASRTVPAV